MKKRYCLLLLSSLLAGCSGMNQEAQTPNTSDETITKIGMLQYMEHPSLDDASLGFKEGLQKLGYVDGENVTIEFANASGDNGNADAIITKFINEGVDLIFANSTPAAQLAANKTTDIPIIITSVTDPAASGLVKDNNLPGVNVSGTSDLALMQTQIGIITDLLPETKTVGVMYCSAEQNSIYQAQLAKETLESLGLEYKEFTVSDSTYILSTAQSVVGQVDALFVPTDNLMAESIATIVGVMQEANIPVVGGFSDVAIQGGLAAYGVNYYALGAESAQMADRVLNGEDITQMPIEYLNEEGYELVINQSVANDLGITIDESVLSNALIIE